MHGPSWWDSSESRHGLQYDKTKPKRAPGELTIKATAGK